MSFHSPEGLARIAAARTKHGQSQTGTYRSWSSMVARCTNPKHIKFHRYGGAGIRVCARWMSFESFLVDMGDRPDGTTIDRIDGARGYEPGNCRWATAREQVLNKRSSIFVEIDGRSKLVSEWADQFGMERKTVYDRIKRGWNPVVAIKTPPQRNRRWHS